MNMAEGEIYVFKNPAGRLLGFFTEEFVSREPELAAKLLPVPVDMLEGYGLDAFDGCRDEIMRCVESGECAVLFYPTKRNEMRTVFFFRDGRCWVRKDVSERLQNRVRFGFRQLKVDPIPIYRGPTVHDLAVAAAVSGGEDGVVEVLSRFVDVVRAKYPGAASGVLQGVAFDAIPANCIVAEDGTYNFFDLEYEMVKGVPLGYFIERTVMTVVPRMNRENKVAVNCYRVADRMAERFGESVDWPRYKRICSAHKRFNTLSLPRILTNVWLSLLPVKAWRERFCWWLMRPELKK